VTQSLHQPASRRWLLPLAFLVIGCTTIAGINEDYSRIVGESGSGGKGTAASSGSGGKGGELVGGSNTGGAVSTGGAGSTGGDGGAGAEDGALGAAGAAGAAGDAGTTGAAGEAGAGSGGTGGDDGGAGATGDAAIAECPTGLPGPELVRVPDPDGGFYCIDSSEVTNKQYAVFLSSVVPGSFVPQQPTECALNPFIPNISWPPPSNQEDHPVAGVDWCDANAFCQWAEKRLCGKIGGGANAVDKSDSAEDSQWFNACSRGGSRTYPYGTTFSLPRCPSFFSGNAVEPVKNRSGCVGGYSGIFDLSGNVAEWEDSCSGGIPATCNVRGGSFQSTSSNLTCAGPVAMSRTGADSRVGFRCCRDLD
jgi:formylglycine-generating enzyme